MKLIVWFAAGVFACCPQGSPAQAQPSPDRPGAQSVTSPLSSNGVTLAAAVDAAWLRAIEATETQGQRQRAEADRVAASSLWAAPPALLFGYRDDRWQRDTGYREAEIALAWPLWLPGQRDARGAAAAAGIELAELARFAARLRVAGEVREAAWTLVALQAEQAQAEAQVRSLQELADDIERRVRAGDLARADALAARAELLNAGARQADARQRLVEARSHWVVLTGLDVLPVVQEPSGEAAAAVRGGMAAHPELRLATQATEVARKRVEVTRSSHRDPPEIALGLRQEVPGRSELTQNSIAIGLRLPFGTDDRNQPLQAAALSELDVAQTREQRLRDRLDAAVAAAGRRCARPTGNWPMHATVPLCCASAPSSSRSPSAPVRARCPACCAHWTLPPRPTPHSPVNKPRWAWPTPDSNKPTDCCHESVLLSFLEAAAAHLGWRHRRCRVAASRWPAPGAHGPNGEHLDEKTQSTAGAALPRVEAKSELFELVAQLKRGELSILVDRYETNEPVLNAKLDVESGTLKATAAFRAEAGDYVVTDAALLTALATPGEHALVFTLVAGIDADLLDGTLVTAVATRRPATTATRMTAKTLTTMAWSVRPGSARPCWRWACSVASAGGVSGGVSVRL